MKRLAAFVKQNKYSLLLAFLIPVIGLCGIYVGFGIYPGSARSTLASDAFSQFSNFFASYRNMLRGDQSPFYTWALGGGLNYIALASYYLGGIFTPLVFFFKNVNMPDALYFLTLLKIGCCGVSFWIYGRQFQTSRWIQLSFSTSYALMSFALAHSELIMWIDAYIYLPLVILGIDRLLSSGKTGLLFASYLLLFLTSFYFGFMIAIFSFLYFCLRTITDWKHTRKRILRFFVTALLAGGAAMVIILPAVMDLHFNGETLNSITQLKTEATNWGDLIVKNMFGVYDNTKYGSIPFIYVGVVPWLAALYFFCARRISLRIKIVYGALFAVLIASFYLQPLNLFWHGMHAPNMFLFRFAFLFSFLVASSGLRGIAAFVPQEKFHLYFLSALWVLLIIAVVVLRHKKYAYLTPWSIGVTLGLIAIYLALSILAFKGKLTMKQFVYLLAIVMCCEAIGNGAFMINGILTDWNYASRSLYSEPYPEIKTLVDSAQKQETDFYRLENLDSVSANDAINYGYHGLSFFSSIRNRNSSGFLNDLGFRLRGTNLNLRYANNTLLADTLMGVRYNIAKDDPQKYGYTQENHTKNYQLYQNQNALPLGFLTENAIQRFRTLPNDNLGTQTSLFHALANSTSQYYQFAYPIVETTNNTEIVNSDIGVTFKEKKRNIAKEITYQITVPAKTQAYFSLYPLDFNELESSSATIDVGGVRRESEIGITGQYYNLGYYPAETTVSFTVSFYGTKSISFMTPKVLLLDATAFQQDVDKIQKQAVALKAGKRSVRGTITAEHAQTLVTTIPYDKGWKAYVDGKEVSIKKLRNAFILLDIPQGKHQIELKYFPYGMKLGILLFIGCLTLFTVFHTVVKRRDERL